MSNFNFEKYLPYTTTEIERELVQSIIDHGSISMGINATGKDARNQRRRWTAIKARAAKQEISEHSYQGSSGVVPDGYKLKGTSTMTRTADGEIIWVKTDTDRARQELLIREAVEALCDSLPKAKAVKAPKPVNNDLLNMFLITDYHIGMLAWEEEAGENWDVDIAEDLLTNWFAAAIKMAPKADTAVFAQLGDFLHYDGLDSVTPSSGHVLDSDSRYQLIVRVAIRTIRRIITMLLKTHQTVHVIMAEGNHDIASSVWLREMLHSFYEDDPRVIVDRSPDIFYCHEHGLTSLFFHHGHTRKPANVDTTFVGKYREVFGRTKYSYAHMGHMHHDFKKETELMTVEQHRTLASNDAYSTRLGWTSGRDAKIITYSKRYGEVGRTTISPNMVKDQEES